MAIQISQDWLEQIKTVLAFPYVDELMFTDDQIKQFSIAKAMRDYFTKFPIKANYEIDIRDQYKIDFPDEYTFGVLDARVVDTGMLGGTGSGFWDVVFFSQMSGATNFRSSAGAYGIKGYNPSGALQTRDLQRQAIKSYQNQYQTVKFQIDHSARQLIAYSTISGKLNITWAKYSDNWDDIKFTHKNDVISLAQSYLLTHYITTVGHMEDSSLETSVNKDAIKEQASTLKTEVFEKWAEIPDILMLHFFG